MIGIERHGLFLIDVLAGVERGGEAFGMQVLRRRDEHGVDGFVVEQMAVIEISLGVGRDLLDLFEPVRVNIGRAHAFDTGQRNGLAKDLRAAVARADDAEADAIIGAGNGVGGFGGDGAGQSGGDFADEIATRLHGCSFRGAWGLSDYIMRRGWGG